MNYLSLLSISLVVFFQGCVSVPYAMAEKSCADIGGCREIKEIHYDGYNALIWKNTGEENNCTKSELTHYVNMPQQGWRTHQTEYKTDCDRRSNDEIKKNFLKWKQSK